MTGQKLELLFRLWASIVSLMLLLVFGDPGPHHLWRPETPFPPSSLGLHQGRFNLSKVCHLVSTLQSGVGSVWALKHSTDLTGDQGHGGTEVEAEAGVQHPLLWDSVSGT